MGTTFWVGIAGSIILLVGAAWPSVKANVHPIRSLKNRFFAVGAIMMLLYAYLGYRTGGSIFFVILETFILVATILMMLKTDDKIDTVILLISGLALIGRSLFLFEGYSTLIFIVGLIILGLGYAFTMGTTRRDVALTLGSAIIALFSYLSGDRIFFFLNLFFMIFSGYYLVKTIEKSVK